MADLRLVIDSRAAKEGADEFVVATSRIKGSAREMGRELSPIQAKIVADLERLKQQFRSGGIAADEYQRRFQPLFAQLQKGSQVAQQAAEAQTQFGRAVSRTGPAIGRLSRPISNLAFSLGGIPGPAGAAISSLARFAAGGGIALAVAGGVAIMVSAYRKLTEEARENKKATEELIAQYRRLRMEQSGELFREQQGQFVARLAQLRRELQEAETARIVETRQGARVVGGPETPTAGRLRAELDEVQRDYARFLRDAQDKNNRLVLDRLAGEKRISDERRKLFDEQVAREQRALKAFLETFRQVREGAIRPRVVGREDDALARQVIQRGQIATERLTAHAGIPYEDPRRTEALRRRAEALERERVATLKVIDAQERLRLGAIDVARETGALPTIMADIAETAVRLQAELKRLAEEGGNAGQAIALAVGQIAGTIISGQSRGASIARGAIGGGAAGFALGGPVGAGIGVVAGTIGGIFGSSAQRRQEREAFQAAAGEFTARRPGVPAYLEELRRLDEEYKSLSAEAKRLKQSTAGLTVSYREQRNAIVAAQAVFIDQTAKSFEARRLRASGLDEEAEALERAIAQERELADLRAAGLPPGLLDDLRELHRLETDRAIALREEAKAAEEAKRARAEADFVGGLGIRSARALGATTRELEDLELALQQQLEAQEALEAGYSATTLAILDQVHAQEQAALAAKRHREELEFGQDLDVRFLRAIGQGRAADELAFTVQQEREFERATTLGLPQHVIDQLATVQKAEREAFFRGLAGELAGPGGARGVSAGVRDITALSEQTGVRIDDRLFTIGFLIRDSNRLLERIAQAVTGGRSGVVVVNASDPVDVDSIISAAVRAGDRVGAENLSIVDSASGVRPTT